MSTTVTSLAAVRKQKTEKEYAVKGHEDLQELLNILYDIIEQQKIEQSDVTDSTSKRLLYTYIQYLQRLHPLVAEIVTVDFNDNSFKMLYPKKYVKPSLRFDDSDAWYFGLEVETTDRPMPDIAINPEAAVEVVNRDLDHCRHNALMIEPAGGVIGSLINNGYRLVTNYFNHTNNRRILEFQHHTLLVSLTFNITVLYHVEFV